MITFVEKSRELIGSLCKWFSIILLSLMTIIMVAQVISRYCFSSPLTWAEELARYQMIALAYVCSVSVMLDRAHLRVTFILDKLSKTTQSMLKVPVLLLQAAFLFLIFYYSIPMLKEGLRVEAVSLGTSMFPFYLPITISFFLMFLESLIQTVEAFIKAYKLLFTGV